MKVKICGISNEIDAFTAISYGADAIGFVMGGRVLPVEVEPYAQYVREAIKKFPKNVDSFLVTHYLNAEDILDLSNYIKSTGIQISEDIALEEVIKVRKNSDKKIIKTIVSNDIEAKKKIKLYEPYCDYFLLDSRDMGYTGGTGRENNWSLCSNLIKLTKKPCFIAGGLNCENVEGAIQETMAYGVDVSTGISCYCERYLRKDRKSPEKIKKFIEISKKH